MCNKYMDRLKTVNENINNLIESNNDHWASQKELLTQHLQFNLNLINNHDLDNPTTNTLNEIEKIKDH